MPHYTMHFKGCRADRGRMAHVMGSRPRLRPPLEDTAALALRPQYLQRDLVSA